MWERRMRKVKEIQLPEHNQMADFKDDPEVILAMVDTLLEEHGLEVVVADDGSDTYFFGIDTRKE